MCVCGGGGYSRYGRTGVLVDEIGSWVLAIPTQHSQCRSVFGKDCYRYCIPVLTKFGTFSRVRVAYNSGFF